MNKQFYRYDNWGEEIHLTQYEVLKETPCGYWITEAFFPIKRRWVSTKTKKAWAYQTKELAWKGFLARKRSQLSIVKAQLETLQSLMELINGIDSDNSIPTRQGNHFILTHGGTVKNPFEEFIS